MSSSPKSICIYENNKIIAQKGECQLISSIEKWLTGQYSESQYYDYYFLVKFPYSNWLFSILILGVLLICMWVVFYILKKPLLKKSQLYLMKSIFEIVEKASQSDEKLSGFEQIIKQQTNRITDLEKQAAMNDMARQVAHDIRSPLSAFQMGLAGARAYLPEGQYKILSAASDRIKGIADDLMARHKKEKNQILECFVNEIVNNIVEEKQLQLKGKVDFINNLNGDKIICKAEPKILSRILSNVIDNSVEAFKSNGQITLSLQKQEACALLIVEDNGQGIPPEVLEKIGQKGFSHGKEISSNSGAGLGVHHAMTTIQSWGGLMKYASELGKGTQVSIQLPLIQKVEIIRKD